jgi:hypothetical protein
MATTFLEPGGDATFNVALTTAGGFWGSISGSPAIATDFVHGNHIKSLQYRPSNGDVIYSTVSSCNDTGTRISLYLYFSVLPNTLQTIFTLADNTFTNKAFRLRVTSAGVLQLWNGNTAQIGTDGSALSTGVWYRISIAYILTSTTVNEIRLYKNGGLDISITNATLGSVGSSTFAIGNFNLNATLDFRSSDHYADNSNSLTDPGDVWVTAKRPNANGTTNGFTTQIGAGGSGYGSGHSPQINERPTSTTNGWSITTAGSAITEEYNIEGKATGDINISNISTVVDYMGWVNTTALIAETGQIIVNGVASNIAITTSATIFTKMAGSTTYPAGTGTDIGIITSTTVTTVSLYECGIVVAYIPPPTGYASWASQTISQPPIGNDIQVV